MSLAISFENQRFAPVANCDICQKRLSSGGNVEYVIDENMQIKGPLHFTCKDGCSNKLRASNPSARWGWMELSHWICCLVDNLKIDLDDARDSVDRLAQLAP